MNLNDVKNDLDNIKRTKFGISVPELRKYAKHIADNSEFLDINDNSTFELRLLHALVIGYVKDDFNVILKYFEEFIPYVDDWAVNDTLCQNFKIARIYQSEFWNFLMRYKNSKKEFESRIVSVCLLSYYLNDKYIDEVLNVLNRLNTDKYYAQMGVAWAVATIMGFYPEKCLEFLKSKNCRLDSATFGKTLQKINESYRVSDDIKLLVKQIVRKNNM